MNPTISIVLTIIDHFNVPKHTIDYLSRNNMEKYKNVPDDDVETEILSIWKLVIQIEIVTWVLSNTTSLHHQVNIRHKHCYIFINYNFHFLHVSFQELSVTKQL